MPCKTDMALLKPGIYTGIHPDTGVIHRLTIRENREIIIERKPYVSSLDGWKYEYQKLVEDAERHLFLIQKIKSNPCDWE